MAKLLKVSEVASLSPDRSSMTRKIHSYLAGKVSYEPMMLGDVFVEYGDNPSIAAALAGTRNKKSLEYKAAIRSVQKWKKGESKPSAKYQEKIKQALDTRDALEPYLQDTAAEQTGSADVTVSATVTISKITEYRTLHATLSGEELAAFMQSGLKNNMAGYQLVANAGNYPPLAAVYGPVEISIH